MTSCGESLAIRVHRARHLWPHGYVELLVAQECARAAATRCPFCRRGRLRLTDTYSGNSRICLAAIHAGLSSDERGGEFTLILGDARPAFRGSKRNGVESRDWGANPVSFRLDSRSADIQKSTSTAVSQIGPAVDGIDHDRDQIWLWLRPQMTATVKPPTSVEWTFEPSAVMNIQFVYVGHLKNPSQIPSGVKAQLDAAGLTTTDYAAILRADPFAFGDVPVDPTRFAALNTTFPYEPPFAPGDSPPTSQFTLGYTVTSSTGTTTVNEYSAGLTVEGDVNFLSVFKASLKTEDSWTWTDETTRSDAVGSSQSASVVIGGPSFGYTGPTDVEVFYDLIYKTFAFKFFQPFARTPALRGVVVSNSGASVAGQEVVVVASGVRHRTFTNALGEFRVFAPAPAVLEVQAGGTQRSAASSGDRIVIPVP